MVLKSVTNPQHWHQLMFPIVPCILSVFLHYNVRFSHHIRLRLLSLHTILKTVGLAPGGLDGFGMRDIEDFRGCWHFGVLTNLDLQHMAGLFFSIAILRCIKGTVSRDFRQFFWLNRFDLYEQAKTVSRFFSFSQRYSIAYFENRVSA